MIEGNVKGHSELIEDDLNIEQKFYTFDPYDSDDPDFDWHLLENSSNDYLSSSTTLPSRSSVETKLNTKKVKKTSEDEIEFGSQDSIKSKNEIYVARSSDASREFLRRHRTLVVKSNSGVSISYKDRTSATDLNRTYPDYKQRSSYLGKFPNDVDKIPPYATPRRTHGPLYNRFSTFSNNASGHDSEPPSYQNFQLLGDSQLLRFSEQLLGEKSIVFHGENSRIRYRGYCVSGQKIKDLEDRLLKSEHKLSKRIILLIGTNDFLQNNDYDSMCASYSSIILHLKENTDNIVLLTVPPIPKFGKYGAYWYKFKKFNQFIMTLNECPKVSVIDLATSFIGYDNGTLNDYFEQHYENNVNRIDLIHLNLKGFKLLKSLLDIHYFDI